jgi:hypothetical protein
MTSLTLQKKAPIPLALAVGLCCCLPATATAGEPQQQPSAYTATPVCAPPSFGHAGCLSLRLVRRSASIRPTAALRTGTSATGASPHTTPSPVLGEAGYTPEELHSAYELPTSAPPGQTIALVDAYNDPSAAEDLAAYSEEFGLPTCASGCFAQYNQEGKTTGLPFPRTTGELETWRTSASKAKKEEAVRAEGWGLEISLDIETAHAICQNCNIALVEAKSTSYADLEAAERAAAGLGATEISNSWGGPECGGPTLSECVSGTQAFDHPGIVITASAGDDGYLSWAARANERGFASFPASSPDVVAVGGTRLELKSHTHAWRSETVWNDGGESGGEPDGHGASGGGCSVVFSAQPWQQNLSDWSSVGCAAQRAVSDVSADADPYTGVAVRYSRPECEFEYEEESGEVKSVPHWCMIGGTSLASPLVASVFALAGGADGVEYPAETLYQNEKLLPASLHDVTPSSQSGSNGRCTLPFDEEEALTSCTPEQEARASCSLQLICLAHSGYDGPTGVGTPHGLEAFKPPSAEGLRQLAEIEVKERAEAKAAAEARSAAEAQAAAEANARTEASRRAEERALEEARRLAEASTQPAGSATQVGATATSADAPAPLHVSTLMLTSRALVALNTRRPSLSQVGFSFIASAATKVRVVLARQVRTRGRVRWEQLHAYILGAVRGTNSKHLSGRGALVAGDYRLTLAPSQGTALSLVFKLG